jgi:hypothetical protein
VSGYDEILAAAPQLRCGDDELTAVFRRRWESFAHDVVRTPRGWVVTEFRQPGPGRAHGTVNAAAGHHILEARWLNRTEVVEDYLRFWFGAPEAEPHRYTEWIAWAAAEHARLHRAWDVVGGLLPGMLRTFRAWEDDSLHPSGLYWAHDLADAMEFSVSGDGLRPTINGYQFGNARAIAEIAGRAGDGETAARFAGIAERLRRVVVDRLYDERLELFTTIPMSPDGDAAYLATAGVDRRLPAGYRAAEVPGRPPVPGARDVRELAGFVPWYFGLPGDEVDPGPSVAQLRDPDGFAGPYGLRTAERRHPRYGFEVEGAELPRFLCRWNGPTWPFATSQTLTALARIARQTDDEGHGRLFLDLLRQYAGSHLVDGEYWLDEFLDPDTGTWIARDWRLRNDPAKASVGRDYNHSTFADLVLAGLLGLGVDDDSVVVDPLPAAAELGWFEVSGLVLAGVEVAVGWSPAGGLALSAGGAVARRAGLGELRVRR